MRDFRDAKAMARTLRTTLAEHGLTLSHSQCLELIARLLGLNDWNTLSAKIEAAGKPPKPESEPRLPPLVPPGRTDFSPELQRSLHEAVAAARGRKHEYATLEHLLIALIDDADAAPALEACGADRAAIKATVENYLDGELESLVMGGLETRPTAGFQRVIQRAVIHVQATGGEAVTGAHVLIAMFSERESHAAFFLLQQDVTRIDVVNFLVHGLRKGNQTGAASA